MKFLVNGELKELNCKINGIDKVDDIIGNSNDLVNKKYDEKNDAYIVDIKFSEFWEKYLSNYKSDLEELEELKQENDYDIYIKIIDEEFAGINDYEDHHAAYQSAFERIRADKMQKY